MKTKCFLFVFTALCCISVFSVLGKAKESNFLATKTESYCFANDNSTGELLVFCAPTGITFHFRAGESQLETTRSYEKVFKYKTFEKTKETLKTEQSSCGYICCLNSFIHNKSLIKLHRLNV